MTTDIYIKENQKKIFTKKGINGILVFLNPENLPKAKTTKTKKAPHKREA